MARNKGLDLDLLQKRITGEEVESTSSQVEYKETPNYIARRMAAQNTVTKGTREKRLTYRINPATCKIRDDHDRNYSNLNEDNCRELIDGIKMHGQETQAIVRQLDGSDGFQYELVCGARRHWVTSYLKSDFIVEIRDLNEEEVFLVSDEENRNRLDITDYERAVKYKRALGGLYTNQIQMAERMGVTQDWLSRYLALATLDGDIIKAYSDLAEIRVRHARELNPLMKEVGQAKRILEAAREMHNAPEKGAVVMATLKEAAKATKKRPEAIVRHYKTVTSKNFCSAKSSSPKKVVLEIDPTMGTELDDWVTVIKSVYKDYGAKK